MEIAQVGDGLGAEQPREDVAARGALQREDGEFAASGRGRRSIAAAAGEEPETPGVEAPYGRVDEDRAVLFEKQRVGDLAGCIASRSRRLQALQRGRLRELVNAHEGKIEQAGGAARGEVLLDRLIACAGGEGRR